MQRWRSLEPEYKNNLFDVIKLDKKINSCIGDIRDFDNLQNFINYVKPSIAFHLAAQPLVRKSYTTPLDTYSTNVIGTANILEILKNTDNIECVINVTSDKCYENREWQWGYRENEAMGGHDPYSASKGCAELVTNSYIKSYLESEIGLASVRAGNVIGGGDWATDRLHLTY